MKKNKILVVGAGFAGAVIARELAEKNFRVTVIEKKNHIAGNCYTKRDNETQIMEHVYGPHIFNTNNEKIWKYVKKFGLFKDYVHRVKANIPKGIFSFPINLLTINQFYNKKFTPYEASKFIKSKQIKFKNPKNFEEQALSLIGKDLYLNFFYGYTKKQWGVEPRQLPASILKRIPVRFNYDDNFHKAKFTGIPIKGYTNLIKNMLAHKNITLKINTSWEETMTNLYAHTFYSGEIDRLFKYKHGKLGYRTVYWKKKIVNGDYQGTAGINFPHLKDKHTRVYEHKHFTPWEKHQKSIIFFEYSKETSKNDIPYYPKRLPKDILKLNKYIKDSKKLKNITLIGRLGTYRYLDMEDVIFESLQISKKFIKKLNKYF